MESRQAWDKVMRTDSQMMPLKEVTVIVKIIISTGVASFIGFVAAPGGDPLSAIASGFIVAFLSFVPLLILSRYQFMKSSTGSVQTLVCVLVCMLALSVLACTRMAHRIAYLNDQLDSYRRAPAVESSPDSPEEQL
jgi:Na+(H+)/acetate symporter ActP